MTDIYSAPTSDLNEPISGTGMGSVQDGIDGNYSFSIGDILGQAWKKTEGSKGTVWLMILLSMVFYTIVGAAVGVLMYFFGYSAKPQDGFAHQMMVSFVTQLIQTPVSVPMTAGMLMVGVRLAAGGLVHPTDVFSYFKKVVPLVLTYILMYVMIAIGICLLVIPGIYLMIAYSMALPLVADKNLSPWDALETSRKAISHNWFAVAGLYLAGFVIMVLAMIPLGIGLIWALPMMLIVPGIVYCTIFGYSGTPAE